MSVTDNQKLVTTESPAKPVTIYALSDPREKTLIRYIGKTIKPLKQRLSNHISTINAFKDREYSRNKWIRSLKESGVRPIIWTIEVCHAGNWIERERFWIRLFHPLLVNTHEGGQSNGNTGQPMSLMQRRRLSEVKKLKPIDPRLTILARAVNLGKKRPQYVVEKVRQANMGRKPSAACLAAAEKARFRKPGAVWNEMQREAARQRCLEQHRRVPVKTIAVICVETGQEFSSMKEAAKFVGRPHSSMSRACEVGVKSGGYHWKKKEVSLV